jgi:hypothetical protein
MRGRGAKPTVEEKISVTSLWYTRFIDIDGSDSSIESPGEGLIRDGALAMGAVFSFRAVSPRKTSS